MAPSRKQQFAKSNNAVASSRVPEESQPSKHRKGNPTDTTSNKARIKTCPTCGHTSTKLADIRSHFAACVKVNGTPTGGHRDDDSIFLPRPHPVKRKRDDLDETAYTDATSTSKRTARVRCQTTQEQRDERQRQFHERLTAVNGIVIPSKLAPGETPFRDVLETGNRRIHQCPVCGSMHKKRYHVQSHFAKCVEKNGNPTGARWDEVWNGAASRSNHLSAQVSQEPPDQQMQDVQPEEYELGRSQLNDYQMDDAPLNDHQPGQIHRLTSPMNEFEAYRSHLEELEPQPMPSSSNSREHYHSDIRHFDPLSSSSGDSTPRHPDLEHLDTQYTSSSSDELAPPHSLPRIETLAKEVLQEMHHR